MYSNLKKNVIKFKKKIINGGNVILGNSIKI